MPNSMTDGLGLVQSATVKGFLGLFGRTLSVADGFSLEVFREDSHLGSIMSNDIKVASDVKKRCERLGARDGDTILRINLGPRMLTMTGKLYTHDGYARAYEIVVQVQVNHPPRFAQRYRQQSDPIKMAKEAVEGEFQKYAERNTHDSMDQANLRYLAEHALDIASNQEIGVVVIRAHKSLLWLDPKYARELELRQQARVNQTELETTAQVETTRVNTTTEVKKLQTSREAELQELQDSYEQRQLSQTSEFVRIEEAKQRDFERLEEEKQQAHLRQQALFGTTAKEIMEALGVRIREEIDMGRPLSEIFNDYPQLIDIFLPPGSGSRSLPGTEPKSLAGATGRDTGNSQETIDELDTASRFNVKSSGQRESEIQPGTVREKMGSSIHSTQLGVTLLPKKLSMEQQKNVDLEYDTAFVVWEIDADSPACKANLQEFDTLIAINGESLRDERVVTDLFSRMEPGALIKLQILRGERLLEVSVDTAP